MKTFLIMSAILLTFLGCSHNNAFDRFKMSKEREISEENIQSAKILLNEETEGVVTAIYLNRVYPELYKDAEYFYVYLNLETPVEKTKFTLNGSPSMLIEELQSTNEFTKLTRFNAKWKRYYLVGFKKANTNLSFEIKNGDLSATLKFKSDI